MLTHTHTVTMLTHTHTVTMLTHTTLPQCSHIPHCHNAHTYHTATMLTYCHDVNTCVHCHTHVTMLTVNSIPLQGNSHTGSYSIPHTAYHTYLPHTCLFIPVHHSVPSA